MPHMGSLTILPKDLRHIHVSLQFPYLSNPCLRFQNIGPRSRPKRWANKIIAEASFGRSSGALHGSRSRRVRRRKRAPRRGIDQERDSDSDTEQSKDGRVPADKVENQAVHMEDSQRSSYNSTGYNADPLAFTSDRSGEMRSYPVARETGLADTIGDEVPTILREKEYNDNKLSRQPSDLIEDIAPVAMTILTDPEMFEQSAAAEHETNTLDEGHPKAKEAIAKDFECDGHLDMKECEDNTGRGDKTEDLRSKVEDSRSCLSSEDGTGSSNDGFVSKELIENEKEIDAENLNGQVFTQDGALGTDTADNETSNKSLKKKIVEHVSQVVDQVVPIQVAETVTLVAEHVVHKGQEVVDQVAEVLPNKVVEKVSHVAEIVEQVALPVAEQVTSAAAQVTEQVTSFLSSDNELEESEDEFEAYRTSDLPEFRGMQGVENFTILQEDQGVLAVIYDFYLYMLKRPVPEFALGMFSAPILTSMIFTLLYLPQLGGLALDETASQFLKSVGELSEMGASGLQMTWKAVFRVFMFSVSLSTGLQPELQPVSPYTLVVANVNALVAQLIFVFLSGAVFARLSQPSQPIRCSSVALICPPVARRIRPQTSYRVLMARYVLVGPQPCELVDVKVDLSYKYNTITRSGSYFRATHSLKLVRAEIAYLTHGMLVRHLIDDTSPLYKRTQEMLEKEDAIFTLSVVGLERSSMQSVFHVQHYSVADGHIIWDAEFEDMILLSKKNKRIVDHSKLSNWRPI